jgi:hypothetical protein
MQTITFQSVFDTPTVAQSKLNSQAQTPDGRIWEYLYATEAITKHMVVSRPANTTVTTVSSSTNGAGQIVFVTEASAGWTVGAYQDHWIAVNTGTGTGQIAKVKDNTADTLELYPEYALSTALAVADSGFAIVHETDAEKIAITTDVTNIKGVAQVTFASGDYGWFLKRGIGGVLVGEAAVINTNLKPGDDTEGTALKGTTGAGLYDESSIGRVLVANSAADLAALVDICIV